MSVIRKLTRFLGFAVATATPMPAKDIVYRALPADLIEHMERQRAFVAEFAAQHGMKKPTGTLTDYDLIQEIVTKNLIPKEQTWKLQALGIIFGDALITEEAMFRWMEVTDSWGTDPVLLFGDTTYQVNALTMISKRVEEGQVEPFVRALASATLRLAREGAPKAHKR